MTAKQAEPKAWATVLLTNGDETVFVLLTAVDDRAYYGSPLNHADPRVVFPKDAWSVTDE